MRGMVRHRLDIPIEELRGLTTSAQYALLGELSKLLCAGFEDVSPPPQSAITMATQPRIALESTEKPALLLSFPSRSVMKNEVTRKDHMMKGKSAELLPHLQRLLTSYDNLDYGRQLNPVDAFFAYRILHGRNPNLADELPHILRDTRTFREFLAERINSDEFSRT